MAHLHGKDKTMKHLEKNVKRYLYELGVGK